MPLTEFRFEAPPQQVAGALVFTLKGELVGILNATLPVAQRSQNATEGPEKSTLGTAATRAAPPATSLGGGLNLRQYGPGGLTVAYSVAPSVLERVIEGFRSPERKIKHPSIGVFCRDTPTGGALIERFGKGSSGEGAGLRIGDVIFEIAGRSVGNQIDFARIMFEQRPGSKVEMKVRRNGRSDTLIVPVGELDPTE
jgi:S1-C subfamily serine protease